MSLNYLIVAVLFNNGGSLLYLQDYFRIHLSKKVS